MEERGLIDRKGELFAILRGSELYTLEGELTGYVQERYVVDLAGQPVWRRFGDAVYHLDHWEPIGYFSAPRPGWSIL